MAGSIKKRPNGAWRARYRDNDGKEHARHFPRQVDARRWLDSVTASVVRGDYVDPLAGRVTFKDFYEQWASRQVWAPNTVRAMDLAARSVTFGDVPLRNLRPSHVELWVKVMSSPNGDRAALAAGTVRTRFNNVHGVLRAAVKDRLISAALGHRPFWCFRPFIAVCAFS